MLDPVLVDRVETLARGLAAPRLSGSRGDGARQDHPSGGGGGADGRGRRLAGRRLPDQGRAGRSWRRGCIRCSRCADRRGPTTSAWWRRRWAGLWRATRPGCRASTSWPTTGSTRSGSTRAAKVVLMDGWCLGAPAPGRRRPDRAGQRSSGSRTRLRRLASTRQRSAGRPVPGLLRQLRRHHPSGGAVVRHSAGLALRAGGRVAGRRPGGPAAGAARRAGGVHPALRTHHPPHAGRRRSRGPHRAAGP